MRGVKARCLIVVVICHVSAVAYYFLFNTLAAFLKYWRPTTGIDTAGVVASSFKLHMESLKREKTQFNGRFRFCPCCGLILQGEFAPFGGLKRKDAMCPRCRTAERHRRLCALFSQETYSRDGTGWFSPPRGYRRPFRLLSFGPHPLLETEISSIPNVDHISLDYFYPGYKYSNMTLHSDVSNLLFPNELDDRKVSKAWVIVCLK